MFADAWTATSDWFTSNKDLISGVASFAAVLGLFATATALFMTAAQAGQQRKLEQAHAIYEIQRDARSESAQLFRNDDVANALLGRPVAPVSTAIGSALNFYASVYQMWRLEVLDDRLFEPFKAELRRLVTIETAWISLQANSGVFDSEFVAFATVLGGNTPEATDNATIVEPGGHQEED